MADLIADGIKRGDYVYDLALGEGYVESVVATHSLPIKVVFLFNNIVMNYNKAGELYAGANQTLYFALPTISAYSAANKKVSVASLAVGTLIYVSNDNVTYIPAYLSKYIAGRTAPVLAYDATENVATTALFYQYARLTP